MDAIAIYIQQQPSAWKSFVREGYENLFQSGDATLSGWGTRLSARHLRLKARVLEPPRLSALMSNQSTNALIVPRNGAYDLRGKKFARAAQLNRWGVIVSHSPVVHRDLRVGASVEAHHNLPQVFDTERGRKPQEGLPLTMVKSLVGDLIRACREYGMQVSMIEPPILYAGESPDLRHWFHQVHLRVGGRSDGFPQLICCYTGAKTRHYCLYSVVF